MKIISTLIATLGVSSAAFGSYLERCEFSGNLSVQKSFVSGESRNHDDVSGVAIYTINSATDAGSHVADACDAHVGETVVFVVDNYLEYKDTTEADVRYFHASNRTLGGFSSTTRYEITSETVHSDAVDVRDIKTPFIDMMPPLPDDFESVSRIQFIATVMSSGCAEPKAEDFVTKIVKNAEGEQVLSIKRVNEDSCLGLPGGVEIGLEADNFDFSSSREVIYNGEVKEVDVRIAY